MSSSPRVTRLSSPVFEVGISPSPLGTADATLASDNDNPAAPNTGRALLRRFSFEVCFAWGIVNSFHTSADVLDSEPLFGATPRNCNSSEGERIRTRFIIIFEFSDKPVISDKTGNRTRDRSSVLVH